MSDPIKKGKCWPLFLHRAYAHKQNTNTHVNIVKDTNTTTTTKHVEEKINSHPRGGKFLIDLSLK